MTNSPSPCKRLWWGAHLKRTHFRNRDEGALTGFPFQTLVDMPTGVLNRHAPVLRFSKSCFKPLRLLWVVQRYS